MKKWLSVVLGVAVSGALLALALRNVRLTELQKTWTGVRPRWVLAMVGVVFCDICIRALRWRILLASAAPGAGVARLFQLETIGLAINNVMFLRLGEIARACLAAQGLGVSALTALATIFVERMTDMMALILLFALAGRLYPEIVLPALVHTAFVGAAAIVGVLGLLVLLDEYLDKRASAGALGRHPMALEFLKRGALGTRALCSWGAVLKVAGLSLALWALDAGLYWVGARAVGLQPPLGYGHSVLILSSAAAGSFLPAVPGSFGTFEAAIVAIMSRLGFGDAPALGYAGFVHIVNYLVVTGLGIVFLYRAGHTLASLKALRPT